MLLFVIIESFSRNRVRLYSPPQCSQGKNYRIKPLKIPQPGEIKSNGGRRSATAFLNGAAQPSQVFSRTSSADAPASPQSASQTTGSFDAARHAARAAPTAVVIQSSEQESSGARCAPEIFHVLKS